MVGPHNENLLPARILHIRLIVVVVVAHCLSRCVGVRVCVHTLVQLTVTGTCWGWQSEE